MRPLTVKELQGMLSTFDPDATVLFQDPNCFNEVLGVYDIDAAEKSEKIANDTGVNIVEGQKIVIIWGD